MLHIASKVAKMEPWAGFLPLPPCIDYDDNETGLTPFGTIYDPQRPSSRKYLESSENLLGIWGWLEVNGVSAMCENLRSWGQKITPTQSVQNVCMVSRRWS